MRTVEEPPDGTETGNADWKEHPGDVLETIDKQLKPFGLEVVCVEYEGDSYEWYIDRRQ